MQMLRSIVEKLDRTPSQPAGLDALERQVAALAERFDLMSSEALRKGFCHDPARFDEFRLRYRAELAAHPEHWQGLLALAEQGRLTLLFAAREERFNNARVLAEFLEEELERRGPPSSPVCYADQ